MRQARVDEMMTTMQPLRKTVIVTAALLLAAVGGIATAQSRGAPSDQPVMVGADDGELSETGFSLRGRAEVTQGTNRMRADAVTGVRVNGQVTRVTATGNVYYVTPDQTIRGDRADYDVTNATIVVSGDVILTQGRNVLSGARLTYNVDSGTASMDGGANNRVRGVFYPQGSSN